MKLATAALAAITALCALAAMHAPARADDQRVETAPLSEAALAARIDARIAEVWQRDGITPAENSADHVFLRRVFLDVVGVPPTLEETRAFNADTAPDKRTRQIETLLYDPRFGEHVATQWLNVLVRRQAARDGSDAFLGHWVANRVNAGHGFDAILFDIITASGDLHENPATAYYSQRRDFLATDIAGQAAKHFTGVQIQCAECHDHPYEENWKTADFNGVASFFSAVRVRFGNEIRPRSAVVTDERRGRVDLERLRARLARQPEAQREAQLQRVRFFAPKYLDGEVATIDDGTQWRGAWAVWALDPGNVQTRRYLANRFWSFLFGTGLHNPVDDFNSFNTPSHPELLDELGADFAQSGFDVRRLYRAILNTGTWQLAAHGAKGERFRPENWHFAQYPVRQLSPEQFFGALQTIGPAGRALRSAKTKPDNPYRLLARQAVQFEKRREEGKLNEREQRIRYSDVAMQTLEALYDEIPGDWLARRRAAANYTRSTTDDEMTETEAFSLTIDQSLLVMNGEATNRAASTDRNGALAPILAATRDDDERLELLYLTVLSRPPRDTEREVAQDFLKPGRKAWEDLFYALMMGTEFATNH